MRHEPVIQTPSLDISGPIRLAVRFTVYLVMILTIAVFVPIPTGQYFSVTLLGSRTLKDLSYRVGGKIEHVHVAPGAIVKPGDLLISLKTEDIGTRIKTMRREADESQEQIGILKAEAFRLLQATENHANQQQKLIEIERRVTAIELTTLALNTEIENAERDLSEMQLRAPIAGVVMDFPAWAHGHELAPNIVVLRIIPANLALQLRKPINETERYLFKVGQPVSVAPSTFTGSIFGTYTATITSIATQDRTDAPEIVQLANTNSYVTTPDTWLVAGAQADLFVELARTSVFENFYTYFFNNFQRSSTKHSTTKAIHGEKT
jgi:multidrug efflux pump subunit AcrA (membrane-fusion protein)